MICGIFARTLSFCGGKKWIIRAGRAGSSLGGAGAPTASGLRNALGFRMSNSSFELCRGHLVARFSAGI
jgi:hypothetical protein